LYSQIKNTHVFYISQPDAHVRELYYANGKWWGNDLTAATNGPFPDGEPPTGFFDGSIEHVFYISFADWHVRELYYTNGKWWGNDLTAATNGPSTQRYGPNGLFDGSIEHVFYGTWPDGHVRELYYTNGKWHDNDLTAATNGPRSLGTTPTSFFDGSIVHVFYVTWTNLHVHELYYTNGKWQDNDLSAATNGPQARPPLTSSFDGSIEHVFYRSNADDHVHELSRTINGKYFIDGWWDNDLTAATNGPQTSSDLTSLSGGSVEHVFYISDPDYHVRELYYANGKWWGNDLTAVANGPQAGGLNIGFGQITSFFDGSTEHVFYLSQSDSHVHELFYYNDKYYIFGWWDNDLTLYTNGPPGLWLASLFFVSVPVIE
jgi:hypothetical protein